MQFYFAHKQLLKSPVFNVACWFLFMVFSSNKWFANKKKETQDKCLISLFNHIGIETGNRKESESISRIGIDKIQTIPNPTHDPSDQ